MRFPFKISRALTALLVVEALLAAVVVSPLAYPCGLTLSLSPFGLIDFSCDAETPTRCTVHDAPGGSVYLHERAAARMIGAHQVLVVDGICASACTVVVDRLTPAGLACATPRGQLAFHEPRILTPFGAIRDPWGYTYGFLAIAIARHGGLRPGDDMTVVRADEVLPSCREFETQKMETRKT